VADSEGGFWTMKGVAKVVGMTGGIGYGGRTRVGCKCGRGSARLSKAR